MVNILVMRHFMDIYFVKWDVIPWSQMSRELSAAEQDGKRRDDDTYIRRGGGCMIFLVISEMIYHSDVSFGVFAQ